MKMQEELKRIIGFSPLGRLAKLREELDRLFEARLGEWQSRGRSAAPVLDVFEDDERFTVKAELPGMSKEDIQISFHGTTLKITGERKRESEEKEGETFRSERWFGNFLRTLELPQGIDEKKVSARYKDGVLCIYLPKQEEAKPKKIEIKETNHPAETHRKKAGDIV